MRSSGAFQGRSGVSTVRGSPLFRPLRDCLIEGSEQVFLAGILGAAGWLFSVVMEPANPIGIACVLDSRDVDIGVVFTLILSRVLEPDRDDVRFLLDY